MSKPSRRDIAEAVLKRHRKSPADRLRIDVGGNTPAPLYQWMVASLLFSARISAAKAEDAAAALFDAGWRTPRKMAEVSWEERVKVLNGAGYARYDESTSRYIADATEHLMRRYDGDLRKLREEADGDVERMRELLKEFKGIGNVGADIFLREVQVAWPEIYPFADGKALGSAGALGLPEDAAGLAALIDRKRDMPRLLAGLVAVDLGNETDGILADAAG